MRYLLLLALLPLLTACGPEVIFEEAALFGEDGWAYADSVRYDFTVAEIERPYNLDLTVHHGTDFSYQNFYVKVHTSFPSGKRETKQSSLQLAGDFGSWRGDCSGESCSLSIPMLSNVLFQEAGDYSIVVEQFSRDEPLGGVDGLGLKVSVAE